MPIGLRDPREFDLASDGGADRMVPLILDVLHGRSERFPALPGAGSPHEVRYGYWQGAAWMVRALLGWRRPDLGFCRLVDEQGRWKDGLACPAGFDRLRELFDGEDQLRLLAAQCWANAHDLGDDTPQAAPGGAWWAEWRTRHGDASAHASALHEGPFHPSEGASDILHLSQPNWWGPWDDMSQPDVAFTPWPERGLVDARLPSWEQLPRVLAASRVFGIRGQGLRVVAGDVGWIATFRYDPWTDGWHALGGTLHALGNERRDVLLLDATEPDVPAARHPAFYPEALEFLQREGLPFERLDGGAHFAFTLGEIRLSGRGGLRTIVGHTRRRDGTPAYVVADEQGRLLTKHAGRAHVEYGPLRDLRRDAPTRSCEWSWEALRKATGC